MKDVVRLLFTTGAAVVAFGLAPQVSAQSQDSTQKVIPCPLAEPQLEEICEFAPFQYMRLENILNTDENFAVSFCGCPDRKITVEDCSDPVCTDKGSQTLAPDASRVSYGDGLEGSKCRKETTCLVPPIGGDNVCETKRTCKD